MNDRIIPRDDLSFAGYDSRRNAWIVREQLYPESRGWIEHLFETQSEAEAFLRFGVRPCP